MKKFKIIEINDSEYSLKDVDNKSYKIYLQFFDLEKLPQVGEYIYFSENLLDSVANEGVRFFSFGEMSAIYGKDIKNGDIDESFEELCVIIRENNKKIYLKRFYG